MSRPSLTDIYRKTWLDPQPGMPGPFAGLGPGPLQQGTQMRSDNLASEADDELIPTAIVIKNIPFAVKKEQLVQLMTEMNLPLPYAFNYHFDNGVFRGLAFANFTSAEETATVIEVLNHFELQGRKLRVEYKKMLPLQERERIEREKRERRGQLEEQHRPMASSQLQTQNSMSSLTSHIPATSPSPVSQHGPRPGKSTRVAILCFLLLIK
jgi:RNA recognition motif-containing protein